LSTISDHYQSELIDNQFQICWNWLFGAKIWWFYLLWSHYF